MKFSFNLIKKLAPGKYDKKALIEKLNLHSFETADAGGDAIEISVAPNRFSDAASHWGIAREAAIIFNVKHNDSIAAPVKSDFADTGPFSVRIQEKKLCGRYLATYISGAKVGLSPDWLKSILEACGLRSINNVVDIMNYAMLETGQPLHAFDADKIKGGIIVRRAKKGEKIETIDNQRFALDKDTLVISDRSHAQAIAGVKGGKSAEVGVRTKNILIEAANFDGVNIYKTSRGLGLPTDASVRFSHNLSPELAAVGMSRALALLKELTGAKIYKTIDVYPKKQPKKLLKLDLKKISTLIGLEFKPVSAEKLLQDLGFKKEGKLWAAPALRTDISDLEDVAEELARFSDYNKLSPAPPVVAMGVAEEDEIIRIKDQARDFLRGAGFSEVYNYSFLSEQETNQAPKNIFGPGKSVEILNPISSQFTSLRDSLANGLARNLEDNLRFESAVRIFEIGKIFQTDKSGVKEKLILGLGIAAPDSFLEAKGLLSSFLEQLGLTDYLMPDLNTVSPILKLTEALRLETDEHQVLGYFGALKDLKNGVVAEIDLEKLLKEVDEEREFEPIAKYPAIDRDVSILVSKSIRVGQILNLLSNFNPKLVEDADLIDYFEDPKLGEDRKSLTFRIVFRSDNHTLTDQEVDREIAILNQVLTERFNAELR